ncbi:hypothetical protein [Priestia aryabhattai]|uniref:hypothetical protein n=1 Tax=Priestia aryabhattai TaxID=412384 RepID=UPI0015F42757|nr:hypothetical protein [Priestia aryabhattai]
MFELVSILGISFLAASIVTTPSYLKLEKEKEDNRKERSKMFEDKNQNYPVFSEEEQKRREEFRKKRDELYRKLRKFDEVEMYDYINDVINVRCYRWQVNLVYKVLRERKWTTDYISICKMIDNDLKQPNRHDRV